MVDAGLTPAAADREWASLIGNVNRLNTITDATAAEVATLAEQRLAVLSEPRIGSDRFNTNITKRLLKDDEVREATIQWLDDLANEFLEVDIGKVGSTSHTGVNGNFLGAASVRVNLTESAELFVDQALTLKGHTAERLRELHAIGHQSTGHPAHVIVHEFGHFLEYKIMTSTRDTVIREAFQLATGQTWQASRRVIADEISTYAATSPSETLAEAFAMVRLAPETAPEIAVNFVQQVIAQVKRLEI